MADDIFIQLTIKHTLRRRGDDWDLLKRIAPNKFQKLSTFHGSTRAVIDWLNGKQIPISADAHRQLDAQPETRGFRSDEEVESFLKRVSP